MLLLILTAIVLTAEDRWCICILPFILFSMIFPSLSTNTFICIIFLLFYFFCVYVCMFFVCLDICVCRCSCTCLCMYMETTIHLKCWSLETVSLVVETNSVWLRDYQVGSNGWLLSPQDQLGSIALVLGLQAISQSLSFCTSIWRIKLMYSQLCRGTSWLNWFLSPWFIFLTFSFKSLEVRQVYRT